MAGNKCFSAEFKDTLMAPAGEAEVKELDLYDDFLITEEKDRCDLRATQQQLCQDLGQENEQLKIRVENLEQELKAVKKTNYLLKRNISILYKTAKVEIERKNSFLRDLQERYDTLVFKRKRGIYTRPVTTSDVSSSLVETESIASINLANNSTATPETLSDACRIPILKTDASFHGHTCKSVQSPTLDTSPRAKKRCLDDVKVDDTFHRTSVVSPLPPIDKLSTLDNSSAVSTVEMKSDMGGSSDSNEMKAPSPVTENTFLPTNNSEDIGGLPFESNSGVLNAISLTSLLQITKMCNLNVRAPLPTGNSLTDEERVLAQQRRSPKTAKKSSKCSGPAVHKDYPDPKNLCLSIDNNSKHQSANSDQRREALKPLLTESQRINAKVTVRSPRKSNFRIPDGLSKYCQKGTTTSPVKVGHKCVKSLLSKHKKEDYRSEMKRKTTGNSKSSQRLESDSKRKKPNTRILPLDNLKSVVNFVPDFNVKCDTADALPADSSNNFEPDQPLPSSNINQKLLSTEPVAPESQRINTKVTVHSPRKSHFKISYRLSKYCQKGTTTSSPVKVEHKCVNSLLSRHKIEGYRSETKRKTTGNSKSSYRLESDSKRKKPTTCILSKDNLKSDVNFVPDFNVKCDTSSALPDDDSNNFESDQPLPSSNIHQKDNDWELLSLENILSVFCTTHKEPENEITNDNKRNGAYVEATVNLPNGDQCLTNAKSDSENTSKVQESDQSLNCADSNCGGDSQLNSESPALVDKGIHDEAENKLMKCISQTRSESCHNDGDDKWISVRNKHKTHKREKTDHRKIPSASDKHACRPRISSSKRKSLQTALLSDRTSFSSDFKNKIKSASKRHHRSLAIEEKGGSQLTTDHSQSSASEHSCPRNACILSFLASDKQSSSSEYSNSKPAKLLFKRSSAPKTRFTKLADGYKDGQISEIRHRKEITASRSRDDHCSVASDCRNDRLTRRFCSNHSCQATEHDQKSSYVANGTYDKLYSSRRSSVERKLSIEFVPTRTNDGVSLLGKKLHRPFENAELTLDVKRASASHGAITKRISEDRRHHETGDCISLNPGHSDALSCKGYKTETVKNLTEAATTKVEPQSSLNDSDYEEGEIRSDDEDVESESNKIIVCTEVSKNPGHLREKSHRKQYLTRDNLRNSSPYGNQNLYTSVCEKRRSSKYRK